MTFSIRIISLESEVERRSDLKKILERMNIDYYFYNAFDARGLSEEDIKKYYSPLQREIAKRRPLTRGEIGCALSHMKCYEDFLENDEEILLVLEDDADLTDFDIGILDFYRNISVNFDVLIIGKSKIKREDMRFLKKVNPMKFLFDYKKYKIGISYENGTCGTVGYIISRRGARELVDNFYKKYNSKVAFLADDWDLFEKTGNIKIAHIYPQMIFENFDKYPSSIEKDRNTLGRNKRVDAIRVARGYFRKFILNFRKI